MTFLWIGFGDSPVAAEYPGSSRNYRLASEQPVYVRQGTRPGSPYPFLCIVQSETDFGDETSRLAQVSGARAGWLFRSLAPAISRPAPENLGDNLEGNLGEHIHLAFTNPADGREDEFNAWYSGGHLQHALLADGFVDARRFVLVEPGQQDPCPYRYLTIYGLKTDDLRASEDDMHRFATGEKPGMPLSDALGAVRATWVYSPIEVEEKRAASANAATQ